MWRVVEQIKGIWTYPDTVNDASEGIILVADLEMTAQQFQLAQNPIHNASKRTPLQ
jgi:hypothetical protein